ncbi:MAG: hypothetical protein ABIN80_22960 [Dyadobacter sp.]|uniref:hypothetical protein n=1 Tax=Dyadobacter sp. TaxID=1914288 RepID=UPI003267DF8A
MHVEQVRVGRRIKHSIPVSPPVKNYLEKWYPDSGEVNKDEFLGMWCINALVRKTVQTKTFTNSEEDIKYLTSRKMTEKWSFMLPVRYNNAYPATIFPKRRVLEFQNMIMKCMYTEILQEMEMRRSRGDLNFIQSTIDNFRNKYNIRDNSFDDDRIRKMYLRFRAQKNIPDSDFSAFLPGMFLGKI